MDEIIAVTGAAGALGAAVARHLAGQGYGLALFDAPRAAAALDALASELGSASCAHAADLASSAGWTACLDVTRRHFGRAPSGAVLAAGGWRGADILDDRADAEAWRAMMTANLETVHSAVVALLPAMVERRSGSIVVVGSRVVEQPWTGAGASAYTASKAAVVAFAQSVAAEVLDRGVRVNAVLPSTLDTPSNRKSMPDADAKRWVGLTSAASVIAFLLSAGARDVSGAAIPLYGRA